MNISRNYVPYFLLVGLIFFLFFFLISIFGYFFLLLIKKFMKKDNKCLLTPLEHLFISYGIGICVYVCLGYFFDLFALFNFLTAYFSIIVVDISFIIIYLYKKKKILKENCNQNSFLLFLKKVFYNKNNLFYTGLYVFTIAIISSIQWIIITKATSLNYMDSYKWYADTFFLLDYGHINYLHLDYNYPSGFTIYNAGVLLIYPNYLFGYYYFKFVPIYFISLYILIALTIVKKLFTRKYLILLSLLFILASRYFLSRTLLYVSSSFTSALLIISLILIINKYPDFIMGVFIAGLYLIHNLTCFFFLFVLFSFYFYKLILNLKNPTLFFIQFKSILIMILITFILLIPYLLSIYIIYKDTILDFILHFFGRFEETDYASILYSLKLSHYTIIKLIFPLDYLEPFSERRLLILIDELFERSIYIFFIFPFIGLFIYIKTSNKKNDRELLIFLKLFIIVIIIFFFLPYFFSQFNLFIKFRKRILQSFSLPIIIMAIYTIEYIINLAKKTTEFLILKYQFYKKILNYNKIFSKLLRIESIIVIIIMASVSASFFQHRIPDYYYYYDDELVEVSLYLRSHAEPNSRILREDFESAIIFRILYDMKIKIWDLNETSSYQDLIFEINEERIDYLIFTKDFFDNETIEDSLFNNHRFKDILENDDFILFRI